MADYINQIKVENILHDIRASGIPFGEVDSTSTATIFTATVPGVNELKDGVCMLLRNGVVTSASGFTININGLGAKPSYSNMATGNDATPTAPTRDTTIFNINYTMLFIYSETLVTGGCWICYRGYDNNTNTIGYQVRTNSMRLPVSDQTGRYRLLFTSADNTHYVPANTSSSTSATSAKTVNQRPIDPFGSIRYYGYTTVLSAGTNVGAGYLWQQYTVTMGYSFSDGSVSMTAWHPVYLKCAPQSDGSAIIDATDPYVQTLPTTDDGKIYIYLGVAYAATTFELTLEHPIYYYKDGALRVWTNPAATGSGLPTVTPADNDKTLKVVNGAWEVANENEVFTVTVSVGEDEETGDMILSADKTRAEILAAINANKYVRACLDAGFFTAYLDYDYYDFGDENGAVNFSGFMPESDPSAIPTNTVARQIFLVCTTNNDVDSWSLGLKELAAPGDALIGSENTPIYWSNDHFNTVPWSLPTTTVGSTIQPVYWDGSSVATTNLATVASTGSYNDLLNKPDETVIVTVDLSNNPTLFFNIYSYLANSDGEFRGYSWQFSSDLVSLLEATAPTKFYDIIHNRKQGIFRMFTYNTADNLDSIVDCYLSVKAKDTDDSTRYFLYGTATGFGLPDSYVRGWSVIVRISELNSTTESATVNGIAIGTEDTTSILSQMFRLDSGPSYILRLNHGGTGLSANDADNWYTSNTLHPHFTVAMTNPQTGTFTCYYEGPLPSTVSSVSDALATDEVQYALKQPVPVIVPILGNKVIGNGLIDNYENMSSSTSMRVLFTDWVGYGDSFVNGIKGILTYNSADGLFLDDLGVTYPKAINSNTSAPDMIVQAAVGDLAVGSTSVPVYWTGSGFAEATDVQGTVNYNDLTNRPVLSTTATTALTPTASETISGTISLHKISKSGNYNDLLNTPTYTTVTASRVSATAAVNFYTGGGVANQTPFTSTTITPATFSNITASRATAGTAVSLYKSGGVVSQTNFTTATITPATFATVTASKATAGTALNLRNGGGVVSQTSFTSGKAFTVVEGTVTAGSAYTGGGVVSQTNFTTATVTPYTFSDVTASKATNGIAVTVHTGGGVVSQTSFTSQTVTPYTFTTVTASYATQGTPVTAYTGGGIVSQTPFTSTEATFGVFDDVTATKVTTS